MLPPLSSFLHHAASRPSYGPPFPPITHHLQAENVLALVNARTAAAADSALAGLQGGLGQLVTELRADVLSIVAELEARLDFDEDLPPLDVNELVQDITGAHGRWCAVLL